MLTSILSYKTILYLLCVAYNVNTVATQDEDFDGFIVEDETPSKTTNIISIHANIEKKVSKSIIATKREPTLVNKHSEVLPENKAVEGNKHSEISTVYKPVIGSMALSMLTSKHDLANETTQKQEIHDITSTKSEQPLTYKPKLVTGNMALSLRPTHKHLLFDEHKINELKKQLEESLSQKSNVHSEPAINLEKTLVSLANEHSNFKRNFTFQKASKRENGEAFKSVFGELLKTNKHFINMGSRRNMLTNSTLKGFLSKDANYTIKQVVKNKNVPDAQPAKQVRLNKTKIILNSSLNKIHAGVTVPKHKIGSNSTSKYFETLLKKLHVIENTENTELSTKTRKSNGKNISSNTRTTMRPLLQYSNTMQNKSNTSLNTSSLSLNHTLNNENIEIMPQMKNNVTIKEAKIKLYTNNVNGNITEHSATKTVTPQPIKKLKTLQTKNNKPDTHNNITPKPETNTTTNVTKYANITLPSINNASIDISVKENSTKKDKHTSNIIDEIDKLQPDDSITNITTFEAPSNKLKNHFVSMHHHHHHRLHLIDPEEFDSLQHRTKGIGLKKDVIDNKKEEICKANQTCPEGKYCRHQLCYDCHRKHHECISDHQCCNKMPCVYGRCDVKAKGTPGTICSADKDCDKEGCCVIEPTIDVQHGICKRRLEEFHQCSPVLFRKVWLGDEKPKCGPCQEGLECVEKGVSASHLVCMKKKP